MPSFSIDIGIEPDPSTFHAKLAATLTEEERRAAPVKVQLEPDVTAGFKAQAKEKVRVALADLDARVALDPALSASFRRDVERLTKVALAGVTVPVTVVPKLAPGFKADLAREIKTVTAGKDIEVPVQASLGVGFRKRLEEAIKVATARTDVTVPVMPRLAAGFRTKLQAAIKALRPVEAEVAMSVDRRSFVTFTEDLVRRATTAADVASQAATIRPGADTSRFGADLAASVAADVAGVSASDIADVEIRPDTSAFTGQLATEVGLASTSVDVTDAASVEIRADTGPFDARLIADVGAATRAAGLTDAASVEIRGDTKGLLPQLEAEVAAVTTAISGTEAASIEIRADTGAAVAEIAAVGAASTEAAGGAGLLAGATKGALIGVAGVGIAAAGAAVGLFKVGTSFDDAFDLIRIRTGQTGDVLAGLEGTFRDIARTAPESFADIATAVADVNQRLGLTGGAAETVATQILTLSRITGTDLAANLENAAGALQSFRVPAEQIPKSLDFLFRASQDSGVAVDVLAAALKGSGAALRTAGFDFGESAALIAQLTKAGIPAETVLQSLSIAARKLAAAGKDPAKGIADLVDQIKAAKTPTDALAIATATFGRGAVRITDAIRSGKFDLSGFFDQVKSGKGSIEGTAAATDDAAESFKVLTNNLKLALEKPAAKFFDEITQVTKDLAPQLEAMAPALGSLVSGLGDVAIGVVRGVVPVMQGLVPALAPIAQAIGDTFAKIGPALQPLAASAGLVVATLTPLIDLVGTALAGAAKIAAPLLANLARAAEPVVKVFSATFAKVLADLAPIISDVAGGFGDLLIAVSPVLVTLVKAVGDSLGDIADIVHKNLAPLLPDVVDAVKNLATSFGGLLDAVLKVLPKVVDFVTKFLAPPVVKAIIGIADAIADLADVLTPFAGVLVGAFIASKVIGGISAIVGGIGNLTRNFTLARNVIAGDAEGIVASQLSITTAAAEVNVAGSGFGAGIVTGAGKLRGAFDTVQTGFAKIGGAATAFKGVALAATAGVSTAFAVMSEDMTTQVIGAVGAGSAIVTAFAIGGPWLGAVAAAGAAIGAIFGLIKRRSDEAAAKIAESKALVSGLAQDFFAAFKDTGTNSALDRSVAVLKVIATNIDKNDVGTRSFFGRFNADAATAATLLGESTTAYQEYARSIVNSRIDEVLAGNVDTVSRFSTEVGIATDTTIKSITEMLETASGAANLTPEQTAGLELISDSLKTGKLAADNLGIALEAMGVSAEDAARFTSALGDDITTLITDSKGAQIGLHLSQGAIDALTQMQDLQKVTELLKDDADRAADAFGGYSDAVSGTADAFRDLLDAQNATADNIRDASLAAIDFAKDMKGIRDQVAEGTISQAEANLRAAKLVSDGVSDQQDTISQLLVDAGGDYDVFNLKAIELGNIMTDQVAAAMHITKDEARLLVDQILKIPDEFTVEGIAKTKDFQDKLATAKATVSDLAGHELIITARLNDAPLQAALDRLRRGIVGGGRIGFVPALAEGMVVRTPTLALVAEAGPEVVLPLTDRKRMIELLREAGVLDRPTAVALSAPSGVVLPPLMPTPPPRPPGTPRVPSLPLPKWVGDTAALSDWVDDATGLFGELRSVIVRFTDEATVLLGDLPNRITRATLGPLETWAHTVGEIGAAAGRGIAAGVQAGADEAGRIADWLAALPGAADGGQVGFGWFPEITRIFHQASGGVIPGPRVNRDVVPAMLMPGEVVIRRDSVERFGLRELLSINAGIAPPGWVLPKRYRDGGEVSTPLGLAPVAPFLAHDADGALVTLLHETGRVQRIVELAEAPSVAERARQVAHNLSVEFGQRPAERTAGDERPVGDAVKAALDRFEQRSLAILAAALDQRPLVGSLTVEGHQDPQRNAAAIVRELRAERYRAGL